jgi:signal transduction histidine kinase
MPKRGIYILVAIVSALLVILIVIQVSWLQSAAQANKREKKLHVERALVKVEEQLKNTNYCVQSYSKVFIAPGESFFMLRKDVKGQIDTLNIFFDGSYSRDGKMTTFTSMDFPFPFTTDIQLRSTVTIGDTGKYYAERKRYYEQVTGKEYKDIFASSRPVDSLFDMKLLDSLLAANLRLEEADTNFGFGLIAEENNKIGYAARVKDSAALINSSYSHPLFSDNNFIKHYRLALVFPAVSGMQAVNWWLLVSIAIIVVLTLSFFAFLRLYRKQSELSEMKTDFINNLTHEFNTPMSNIALALETLQCNGHVKDNKVANILCIISNESARLKENIERSLQVATLEKGNLKLHKEEIDLIPTLNAVITAYQLQCEQYGGSIDFIHTGDVSINGDETHLLNCMVNLLDNAIKYRNGPPMITVMVSESEKFVNLVVQDNGKGMSPETQKHIFEKFYRAHEGDTHNTKGFGLGLNYVKGIVEAHGGKIEVWSRVGGGTRFTIKLKKSLVYEQ